MKKLQSMINEVTRDIKRARERLAITEDAATEVRCKHILKTYPLWIIKLNNVKKELENAS